MADFTAARRAMLDTQIRPAAVNDQRLLDAMAAVPRENFVPVQHRALAYLDRHIPLSVPGRALASPASFARLAQLADIRETDRVLDLGIGSGYSSAIFSELAAEVVGVEANPTLAAQAAEQLNNFATPNFSLLSAPPAQASGKLFDCIFFEGALTEPPTTYYDLLAEGGRLVAVILNGATGVAWVFRREGQGMSSRSHFNVTLPLFHTEPKPTQFVF